VGRRHRADLCGGAGSVPAEACAQARAAGRHQHRTAELWLRTLDNPLRSVEHHSRAGRQVQHHHHRVHHGRPSPSHTRLASPSGQPSSTPNRRCHNRCSRLARATAGAAVRAANSANGRGPAATPTSCPRVGRPRGDWYGDWWRTTPGGRRRRRCRDRRPAQGRERGLDARRRLRQDWPARVRAVSPTSTGDTGAI
jgi:hypothetical protein